MGVISLNRVSLRFPALKERNFARFLAGQSVSMIGFWMQTIGMSWLVLKLTDSPLMLGTVTILQTAPMLLFSVFAGTVADRFNKRKLLFFTQGTMGALALILGILVATNTATLPLVMIFSLVIGCVNTLDVPARQCFVMELAGRDSLMNAISLNSTAFNLARFAGPGIAGLVIGAFGIAPCFIANALSFGGVLLALKTLDPGKLHIVAVTEIRPKQNPLRETLEGLVYVGRERTILFPIILMAAISTFVINYTIVVPLFAKNELGGDAALFGFLMASMGAGSFLAAFSLASSGRKKPNLYLLYGGAASMSVLLVVLGMVPSAAVAVPVLFISGFATISFTSSCNSHIQLNSHPDFRGRVMGVFVLVFGGVTPIGSFIVGYLCEHIGVRLSMALCGGAGFIASALVIALRFFDRTRQTQAVRQ